jgi:hypothetical protein
MASLFVQQDYLPVHSNNGRARMRSLVELMKADGTFYAHRPWLPQVEMRESAILWPPSSRQMVQRSPRWCRYLPFHHRLHVHGFSNHLRSASQATECYSRTILELVDLAWDIQKMLQSRVSALLAFWCDALTCLVCRQRYWYSTEVLLHTSLLQTQKPQPRAHSPTAPQPRPDCLFSI